MTAPDTQAEEAHGRRVAVAPEYTLRPVLTELGALTPVPGLYVRDADHADATAYEPWLTRARPIVRALLRHRHDLTGAHA